MNGKKKKKGKNANSRREDISAKTIVLKRLYEFQYRGCLMAKENKADKTPVEQYFIVQRVTL